MIKMLLKVLVGIVVLIAVAVGGFIFWLQSKQPAQEERMAFGNDQIIAKIDAQLKDVDVQKVKSKSNIIEQQSLANIQANLASHQLTHEELVAYYLIKIKEEDQSSTGNNAISEINPHAIEEARHYDTIANENIALAGIPVVVKENINTNDMPTSSGTQALKDFIPEKNAPVVDQLKSNGAIILGKTNLSELSYYMSSKNPSGYSSKKGQTHNPFGPLKISALGSSTGSAVAMATDLATLAIGTETAGSIVAPSSVNSVVGYKPTQGFISGEGVIPITYTLDTVGPIAKNVTDVVATYNAATTQKLTVDFDKNAIKGKRIGIMDEGDNFSKDLINKLNAMGANVVIISPNMDDIDALFILKNDFERDLNDYLTKNNAPIHSLKELIAFNKQDSQKNMRYGQDELEAALNFKDKNDDKVQKMRQIARQIMQNLVEKDKLDAIVFRDSNGTILPAVAGAPEVSVPFGIYEGTPAGATFSMPINEDAKLLQLAYSFEQNTNLRKIPNK